MQAREAHLRHLLTSGEMSDVTVKVGEKLFKCHKNMLIVSGFFREMFESNWQEAKGAVALFAGCDSETFAAVLEFIYLGTMPPQEKCAELYQLAKLLKYEKLKEVAKWQIFARIDPQNCLEMALYLHENVTQDPDLEFLISWYFNTYSFETADLADHPCAILLQLYKVGLKYQSESLKKASWDQFYLSFDLKTHLVDICKEITKARSPEMRERLNSLLKGPLGRQLEMNKEDQLKAHFEAYRDLNAALWT